MTPLSYLIVSDVTHFSCSVLGGDDGGQGAQDPLRDEHQTLGVLLHGARADPQQPGRGELLQPGQPRPQELGYGLPPLAAPHPLAASLLIHVDTDLLSTGENTN